MSSTAMNLALSMAGKAENPKWRLGSVLWRGGSVIACGYNKRRNDPVFIEDDKHYECSVHAEIDAIKRAKKPEGATIYVARITPAGAQALAKPCCRCQKAIKDAGIKKIVFTTSENTWVTEKVDHGN
jgi:deoxycytidylate deaminase